MEDNNTEDDNKYKGISALGLDRDLFFCEYLDVEPHDLIKFAHIRPTQTRAKQIHVKSTFSMADTRIKGWRSGYLNLLPYKIWWSYSEN